VNLSVRSIYLLAVFVLTSLGSALGQGCFNWMIPQYNVYTTVTADRNHIYTSVLIDGTTGGTCGNGCDHCNQIMNPPPVHTPKAYNLVSSTGGWATGTALQWNQYISEQNNQSVSAVPGQVLSLNSCGVVNCSAAGGIFNSCSIFQVESATTRVISYGPQTGCYKTGTGTNCYYPVNNWCSPATTPPDNNFNATNLKDAWPITFPAVWDAIAGCARIYGLTSWYCTGAIAYIISQGNPVAPKIDCTY